MICASCAGHAPLVPFDLLRIPIFGLSVATSICSFTAQMLAFVSLPFYFETVLGRSAVETGPPDDALAGRRSASPRPSPAIWPTAFPLACSAASAWLFCAAGLGRCRFCPTPGSVDIVWRMAICGVGFGIFQSPNNRAMMAAAPTRRSGAAGGMLATARLIGQTTGAAGVALIFRLQGHGATNLTLIVAAIVAAVAACVSLTRLVGGGATPAPASATPAEA